MAVSEVAQADIELVRQELQKIAAQKDGYISPEDVVVAARIPESPLHDRFLWDDSEAAHRFRLVQAGMLLRRVKITVIRMEGDQDQNIITVTPVRRFQSDPNRRQLREGSYARVEDLMADPDKRVALLQSARTELLAIRKRYAELEELSAIWKTIDALA